MYIVVFTTKVKVSVLVYRQWGSSFVWEASDCFQGQGSAAVVTTLFPPHVLRPICKDSVFKSFSWYSTTY